MDEKLPSVWVVLVAALSVIGALIGAIWLLLRAKVERLEARLDEHVRDDINAHERLKAAETKIESLDREVTGLRERWHDLRNEISQTLSSWYMSVIKMVGGGK
jgi:chromosome segregation ATPase